MRRVVVFSRFLFLVLAFFSLFLLVSARSGEVHTVWEFMNPLFLPVFLAVTLLLVGIILSREDVRFKLVFTMLYCFIGVSFYAIIFPAGTLGAQQSILGVTRLLYDGTVVHGFGGDAQNVFVRIFNWLDKPNFQSALTIVFARMFGADVFGVHLFFLPVLWGIFVPSLVFLIARTLNVGDKAAALSGLLGSAFPLLVFSGSVSIPASLGYVFFLGTLLFCLRYLASSRSSAFYWMIVLGFAAFVSHFLAGIMSIGFIVLALAVRRYSVEKSVSSLWAARFVLVLSFVIAVSLLPLALRYLSLVSPLRVYFGLENLEGLSAGEVVGLFLIGEYVDFSTLYAVLNILGPLLGLVGVFYVLYASRRGGSVFSRRVSVLFLFVGFLVTFVDYRVLKMFMVGVPFSPNRVWVFRNFALLPFVGFVVCGVFEYFGSMGSRLGLKSLSVSSGRLLSAGLRVLVLVGVSVLVVASVFSVYPQFGPLQITSYELDVVRHLEAVSNDSYVVIGDQFIAFAGGMLVGVANPRAFYVSYTSFGLELFNEMKANPSAEVMVSVIDYANVSIAYFVVDKPRLDAGEFDRVVSAALNNGLQMLPVSFGDGKVVIFRYERL